MKKIYFFIILSELLFSLSIERNKNTFIPSFLRLGSNETLIHFSTSYDTLTHKSNFHANIHLYLKLFSKKKTKTIKKTSDNKKNILIYCFKSRLGIKEKNKKPLLEFKNSFKLTYKNIIFYEEITPAVPFYYKEKTDLELKNKNIAYILSKSYSYKQKGINYSFTTSFFKLFKKFTKTINFSINGNTSKKPVIYSYNLSTSYRFILFNKQYLYININPYILCSKDYSFKIKPAFFISLNYDF